MTGMLKRAFSSTAPDKQEQPLEVPPSYGDVVGSSSESNGSPAVTSARQPSGVPPPLPSRPGSIDAGPRSSPQLGNLGKASPAVWQQSDYASAEGGPVASTSRLSAATASPYPASEKAQPPTANSSTSRRSGLFSFGKDEKSNGSLFASTSTAPTADVDAVAGGIGTAGSDVDNQTFGREREADPTSARTSTSSFTRTASRKQDKRLEKEREKYSKEQEKQERERERQEVRLREQLWVPAIPPEAQKALAPLAVTADIKPIHGTYAIELTSTTASSSSGNGVFTTVSPTARFDSTLKTDIDVTLYFRPTPAMIQDIHEKQMSAAAVATGMADAIARHATAASTQAAALANIPLEILLKCKKGKIRLVVPDKLPTRPLRIICTLECESLSHSWIAEYVCLHSMSPAIADCYRLALLMPLGYSSRPRFPAHRIRRQGSDLGSTGNHRAERALEEKQHHHPFVTKQRLHYRIPNHPGQQFVQFDSRNECRCHIQQQLAHDDDGPLPGQYQQGKSQGRLRKAAEKAGWRCGLHCCMRVGEPFELGIRSRGAMQRAGNTPSW